MIYCATIIQQGITEGTWTVSPSYTRNDGKQAPNILAIAANGIKPAVNDIVLCAEGINPFDHSSVRSFDHNGGANPVIIATYAQILDLAINVIIQKLQCGEGSQPMVLGNNLATWAKNVDGAIQALYNWGLTGTPPSGGPVDTGGIIPFSGQPSYTPWSSDTLSENHTLD